MALYFHRYGKMLMVVLALVTLYLWIVLFTPPDATTMQMTNKSLPSLSASLGQPRTNDLIETDHYINVDLLKPEKIIGPGNTNATYVFGIPHVHRPKRNYIIPTLESLIYNVPTSHMKKVLFVVLFADIDRKYVTSIMHVLQSKFDREIQGGLLQLIVPSRKFYPDFHQFERPHFFQGPYPQFLWTSKQNYDYAYLMLNCKKLGKFYIQMEDDVETHNMYIQHLEEAVSKKSLGKHWFVIDFSTLGFIGKLFHSKDITLVAQFLLTLNSYKPVDWLLDYLIPLLGCRPEMSERVCQDVQRKLRHHHRPSLFQHRGTYSSLKSRIQPLKDNSYRPPLPVK